MVRINKTAEARQDQILDAAQKLFVARGYSETPVQAIIDAVGIAKGTFYHHYPSKSDLLDALVRRMVEQSMTVIRPVVADPDLGAVDKLNALYQRAMAWKSERRELLIDVGRALASEANVVLMKRIERDSEAVFVPLVAQVITQGVAEGAFDTRHPLHAARSVHVISTHMFVSLREALMGLRPEMPPLAEVQEEIAAFHDAVERVLGARRGTIHLVDPNDIVAWMQA